jgi:hypothetical protein
VTWLHVDHGLDRKVERHRHEAGLLCLLRQLACERLISRIHLDMELEQQPGEAEATICPSAGDAVAGNGQPLEARPARCARPVNVTARHEAAAATAANPQIP